MSNLTGDFDLVLQVKEKAIERVLRAQHTAGATRHSFARNFGEKRVDLVINGPFLTLLPTATPEDEPHVLLTDRVFYHSRILSDEDDLGNGAVADVAVRVRCGLSSGNPGKLSETATLVLDWEQADADDVTVYGVSGDLQNEVEGALINFIDDNRRGIFAVPPLGTQQQRIGSLGFRFLPINSERVLVAGMNVGDTIKGSKEGLTESVVQQDYALVLSADYVLKNIRERLRQQYPLPYRLSRTCTIRSPFSSDCWNWRTVSLRELNVFLIAGRITVVGKIKIRNSGALIPDQTAAFAGFLKLSISSNQRLQVTVESVAVSLQGWYSDVLNFLSGGALIRRIRDGITQALGSASGNVVSDILTPQALSKLASVGTTMNLDIQPRATDVVVRSDAIVIHGYLLIAETDAPPVVSFVSSQMGEGQFHYKFHAGQSWAPGGGIVQYEWDFGDGQTETTSGTNARFVTDHHYTQPPTRVCLTITDDKGRARTNCGLLGPIPPIEGLCPPWGEGAVGPWEVPLTTTTFAASFCGRVPGVLVRVSGPDWTKENYTNRQGRASFILNPRKFWLPKSRVKEQVKVFETGRVLVEAFKDGFHPVRHYLSMVRVDDRKAFVNKTRQRLRALMKELCVLFPRNRTGADSKTSELEGGRVDPRIRESAEDIAFSVDVMAKIINLIERGSDMSPFISLLGMDGNQTDPTEVIISRCEECISGISKLVKGLVSASPDDTTDIKKPSRI